MLTAALAGLIAAFIASMPVAGPVAALIVRHALEGRPKNALALGFGTGLAEGTYAFLALWGFSTFLADYPIVVPISKIVAAVILIGLGVWFTRFVPETPKSVLQQGAAATAPEADQRAALGPSLAAEPRAGHRRASAHALKVEEVLEKSRSNDRPLHAFGVGFSVTVLNPTLLATWAAAATTIASMNLFPVEPSHALPFAVGVVCGASGWFTLLVWLLSRFRHHFSPLTLQRVIRAMGWGLIGLGGWFLVAFILYVT